MPRVPVYEPTVRISPIAAPQRAPVSADAFGAGLAEGLGRTAMAVDRMDEIAQRERFKQDRAALDLAETALANAGLDSEIKLKSKQGIDAIKASDGIYADFQKSIQETRKTLATPEQQQAFDQIAARHDLRIRSTITDHTLREGERVADSAAEAKAATYAAAAVQHRGDLLEAYSDLTRGGDAIMARLTERGADPLVRAKAREDYISRGVADLVAAKADDRDHVGAAQTLEQFSQFLTNPADLARAQRVVEQASTMGESMRIVDDLMRTTPTVQGVMDRARTIQDPILRKAVEDRGMDMLRLRNQAHEQGQAQIMQEIYQQKKDGRDPSPSQLAGLDAENRERLQRWMTPEKIPWQESKAIRYRFEQAMTNPAQRREIADTDLLKLRFSVNEADFQAMVEAQKEARQGGTHSLSSIQEHIDTAFVELTGAVPKPFTVSGGKAEINPKYVTWRDAVTTEANAIAAAAKREKPNLDDVQKAIDSILARKVRLDEIGRDPEMVSAMVEKGDRPSAYLPLSEATKTKAGEATIERIRAAIIRAGGTPNDNQLERAAAAEMMGDSALLFKIIGENAVKKSGFTPGTIGSDMELGYTGAGL